MTRKRKILVGTPVLLGLLMGGALTASRSVPSITTVGRWPSAMAVDVRTAHVFVVNNTDGVHPGTVSILDAASGVLRHTKQVDENRS